MIGWFLIVVFHYFIVFFCKQQLSDSWKSVFYLSRFISCQLSWIFKYLLNSFANQNLTHKFTEMKTLKKHEKHKKSYLNYENHEKLRKASNFLKTWKSLNYPIKTSKIQKKTCFYENLLKARKSSEKLKKQDFWKFS